MALAEVEQARVHLTFPKDSVFLEAQQPAKASVLVQHSAGRAASRRRTSRPSLTWWRSAVEGLEPGCGFRARHERQSAQPSQGPGDRWMVRNPPRRRSITPPGRNRAARQDQCHPVATARARKISRRRLRGMRFHRRRAERRDLRSGAQRHGHVAAHRRFGRRRNGLTGSPAPLPPCPALPRVPHGGTTRPSALRRISPINPAAPSRRPTCRRAWCARCRSPCWWTRMSPGRKTRTPSGGFWCRRPRKSSKSFTTWWPASPASRQERGDQLVIETLPFETTLQLEPP